MDLQTLRHSTSHVMAQAVKDIYPDVKIAIGPAIENGFYYDFDREIPFTPDDLEKIEKRMWEIIKGNFKFEKKFVSRQKALELFKNEPYKIELINRLPENEDISIYQQDTFIDLCKGPHINYTKKIKAFKLLKIAGAYWCGDEKNKMLQRIYGTAFETKKELMQQLEALKQAQERDHRKLGQQLDLFSMHEKAGAGLIFYHHKGAVLRMLIEDFEKKEHLKRGYQMVMGPHILKSDIWVQSGHYDFYKENMYMFNVEGQEFAIKPMNCPAHMLIYKNRKHSYREFPIRYFELGNVYRHEKSGVLHGLLRVRGFTQDDAHIFCLPKQLVSEIKNVIDFVIDIMNVFGFKEYEVELSTRPEKSIGSDLDWENAENALKQSLSEKKINYSVHKGDGAFYGPKIDIKLKDALGRAWQCATIQCDFALPVKFDLTYIGEDGHTHRPVMLHRVVLGSIERFIGALIEHYAGAFPVWLAPTQIMLIPISQLHYNYAQELKNLFEQHSLRVEVDSRNEKMQYKIREAQQQKIPYMLIVGNKEMENQTVSVRSRKNGDQGAIKTKAFLEKILKEIKGKIN